MKLKHFVGIDVSKNTLDISLNTDGLQKTHIRIANTTKDIGKSIPEMLKQHNASKKNTVFCMEYTGIYNRPLLLWLQKTKGKIWIEPSERIRNSQGLIRGKNDKIDSERIAMYAFTYRHKVKIWEPPSPLIEQLAAMLSQRYRLLKAKVLIQNACREQKIFYNKSVIRLLGKYTAVPLAVLDEAVKSLEKGILAIIKNDENLNRLYKIIVSVDGVGFFTASNILVTTQAFKKITQGKKFACYAGVVPFQYKSGSSVQSQAKVSRRANKTLKTLLHISAVNAIRKKGDLQDYYRRKLAEGKNKMSVINAVRNKIVLRVFSCVRRNQEYVKYLAYHPSDNKVNLS